MYEIKINNFSGPLDLLLQLIEDKELDITAVALAEVTDQYLGYVQNMAEKDALELADFLVVAAKLVYSKSRAILPFLNIEEEEEESDLADQLRMYKEFAAAAKVVEQILSRQKYVFSREVLPDFVQIKFTPPNNLNLSKMRDLFQGAITALEPLFKLPTKALEKVISLQEKVCQLQNLIADRKNFLFTNLINLSGSRTEVVVSFMALLELLKKREVSVDQVDHFGEIFIKKT